MNFRDIYTIRKKIMCRVQGNFCKRAWGSLCKDILLLAVDLIVYTDELQQKVLKLLGLCGWPARWVTVESFTDDLIS